MALTTSLIEYWKLDEASGNRAGAHNSITLTDNGTVGSNTGLVYSLAGDFETSTEFEWLDAADSASLSLGDIDFTLAALVKLESKGANRDICGKGDGDDQEYVLRYQDSSDRFRFTVYGSSGFSDLTFVDADALGSPSTGTFYWIVVDHDSTNDLISIQVNNGTINTAAHTFGCYDSNAPFAIGRGNSVFPGYMDGIIGPVIFWKRLLDSGERSTLWNGGTPLTYAALNTSVTRPAGRMALLGVGF